MTRFDRPGRGVGPRLALHKTARALTGSAAVIGGLLLAMSAHAATGFTVVPEQEKLIQPGMTADEVQKLLGRPSTDFKYFGQPGRTYTYRVVAPIPATFFIDFGKDGKVASSSERIDYPGGDGNGGGAIGL